MLQIDVSSIYLSSILDVRWKLTPDNILPK